jgi:hypothetical protein
MQDNEAERAHAAERARILAAPLIRADAVSESDPYPSRRIESMLWTAEALIEGEFSCVLACPTCSITAERAAVAVRWAAWNVFVDLGCCAMQGRWGRQDSAHQRAHPPLHRHCRC